MTRHPLHVWVVDDDQSVRWVLEKALKQADMEPRSFERAEHLLAAVRRSTGRERQGQEMSDGEAPRTADGAAWQAAAARQPRSAVRLRGRAVRWRRRPLARRAFGAVSNRAQTRKKKIRRSSGLSRQSGS